MKQITDVSELKLGTQIIQVHGDQCTFWEYLCLHPKNSEYVLLLESLSQDAIKQYIPNLLNSGEWFIEYTFEEIWERRKEWHLRQINKLNERIKDEQGKKAKKNNF